MDKNACFKYATQQICISCKRTVDLILRDPPFLIEMSDSQPYSDKQGKRYHRFLPENFYNLKQKCQILCLC